MRLNHLNLTVPDVPRTREFFETYFGFRCVAEKGRDALAVLVDESGFLRVLDTFTGKELFSYDTGNKFANSVQFNRDGSRIVTASSYGQAYIWDARLKAGQGGETANRQPPRSKKPFPILKEGVVTRGLTHLSQHMDG